MVPELHGCSVTCISSLGLTPKTDEVKGSKRIILCMQSKFLTPFSRSENVKFSALAYLKSEHCHMSFV